MYTCMLSRCAQGRKQRCAVLTVLVLTSHTDTAGLAYTVPRATSPSARPVSVMLLKIAHCPWRLSSASLRHPWMLASWKYNSFIARKSHERFPESFMRGEFIFTVVFAAPDFFSTKPNRQSTAVTKLIYSLRFVLCTFPQCFVWTSKTTRVSFVFFCDFLLHMILFTENNTCII